MKFRTFPHDRRGAAAPAKAGAYSDATTCRRRLQPIILGAVQGLTEFLPISSTAHLILVPKLLGWEDPGLTFDVALHLGTLVALLIYFQQDWINLVKSGMDYARGRTKDPLFFYIVAGTIPAGIAGLFLEKLADRELRDLR